MSLFHILIYIDIRQNVLSVKQMFMRYLSHEIRTPLNSVFVGLKIMLTELQKLGLQEQHNLLETTLDTQKSCQSAVDILDDMILYDRILYGLLALDKTLFNPWFHIRDIVGLFRSQVGSYHITSCTV